MDEQKKREKKRIIAFAVLDVILFIVAVVCVIAYPPA